MGDLEDAQVPHRQCSSVDQGLDFKLSSPFDRAVFLNPHYLENTVLDHTAQGINLKQQAIWGPSHSLIRDPKPKTITLTEAWGIPYYGILRNPKE